MLNVGWTRDREHSNFACVELTDQPGKSQYGIVIGTTQSTQSVQGTAVPTPKLLQMRKRPTLRKLVRGENREVGFAKA